MLASENFFITTFAQKNREQKNFDVTFSLTRILQKTRTINETMNPIFGLRYEI